MTPVRELIAWGGTLGSTRLSALPRSEVQSPVGLPLWIAIGVAGLLLVTLGLALVIRGLQGRSVTHVASPPGIPRADTSPDFYSQPPAPSPYAPTIQSPVDLPAAATAETRRLGAAIPRLEPAGGLAPFTLTLPATIGRAVDNQVIIGDNFPGWETVSRHHARIYETSQGETWIEDTGSQNGVFVNGERITQAVLADGAQVKLGDVEFTFHL